MLTSAGNCGVSQEFGHVFGEVGLLLDGHWVLSGGARAWRALGRGEIPLDTRLGLGWSGHGLGLLFPPSPRPRLRPASPRRNCAGPEAHAQHSPSSPRRHRVTPRRNPVFFSASVEFFRSAAGTSPSHDPARGMSIKHRVLRRRASVDSSPAAVWRLGALTLVCHCSLWSVITNNGQGVVRSVDVVAQDEGRCCCRGCPE